MYIHIWISIYVYPWMDIKICLPHDAQTIKCSVPRGQKQSQELRRIDEPCPRAIKWWLIIVKDFNIKFNPRGVIF